MADDTLDGIEVGVGGQRNADEKDPVEQIVEQLEVSELSELTDRQLKLLGEAFEDKEDLEGIEQEPERDDRSRLVRQRQARQMQEIRDEEFFQRQLQEIEEIGNSLELLRRIAASVQTMATRMETNNSLLRDVIDANSRGSSLVIKDSDLITFEESDTVRDVTEETDVTTSTLIVKADTQNSDPIYFGGEELSVGSGLNIEPGEKEVIPVDILSDEFKAVAESAGDQYSYIAFGLPSP